MTSDNLVHFDRHGQFAVATAAAAPVDGLLTALGRRQARRTASRFREHPIAACGLALNRKRRPAFR